MQQQTHCSLTKTSFPHRQQGQFPTPRDTYQLPCKIAHKSKQTEKRSQLGDGGGGGGTTEVLYWI